MNLRDGQSAVYPCDRPFRIVRADDREEEKKKKRRKEREGEEEDWSTLISLRDQHGLQGETNPQTL